MSGDRVFRDLNYEDALAALQKAQVDLAVEQGKRKGAETAENQEAWHQAARMMIGMLLVVGFLFSLASSAASHRVFLYVFGLGLVANEIYYRAGRKKRQAIIAEGNADADSWHAEHADDFFFVEGTDYAPHLVNELLKILRSGQAETLKGALNVYDGRFQNEDDSSCGKS